MSSDEEKDIGETLAPNGHPSLADFIAKHRDHSTAIYRDHENLSARNLLHLQSELAELRVLQLKYDREDAAPREVDAKERSRDWKMFKTLTEEPGGNQKEQERMKLTLKIRATMKEYSKFRVYTEGHFYKSRKCSHSDHLRSRIIKYFAGNSILISDDDQNSLLLGGSWDVYKDRHELIALARTAEEDRLTMVLRKFLPFLFSSRIPRDGRVASLDDGKIRQTVALISFRIASVLLYGAILDFYYVRDERAVLGLIALWAIAFAMCWLAHQREELGDILSFRGICCRDCR